MVPRLKCRIGIEPELAVGSVARDRRRGSTIFLLQRGSPELADIVAKRFLVLE
jgi:hypothetical protein